MCYFMMPRNRQRTAAHVAKSESRAVKEVARKFDICHASFHRYLKNLTDYEQSKSGIRPTVGCNSHTRVLNKQTEKKIVAFSSG